MEHQSIVLERVFNSPVSKVWNALTDKNEMKKWYFDLTEFKAEAGFQFQFFGGPSPEKQYLHVCEVTEVIPQKKLTYSWRYDGYEGKSFVTFELSEQGNKTLLRLTHGGIETFPASNPDFAIGNFKEGWNHIIHISLKEYLEPGSKQDYQNSIAPDVSPEQIFISLTQHITDWWTNYFEGSAQKENDIFTVRFGKTYKTFEVEELVPDKTIVWLCVDSYIDMASLKNKNEWKGTKLVWDITPGANYSRLMLTHVGLSPEIECYLACEKGWNFYLTESLSALLSKGQGLPYKKN